MRYLAKRKTNYTTRDFRKMTCLNGVISIEGQTPGSIVGPYMAAESAASAERFLVAAIAKLEGIGQWGRCSASSPEYLPKKMLAMKLAGPHTLKELSTALNKLLLDSKVREFEVGKLANRMPRMGVKLC